MRSRILTAAEGARLIEACGGGVSGRRNRALVALGYRAGLRCNEALSIHANHFTEAGLFVRTLKGGIPREIGLDPKTYDIVRELLQHRASGRLFVTRTGLPMLPSYVRQLMNRLGDKAEIPIRVHYHLLRHTFARQLYDEKLSMKEIQLALGHRSLGSTGVYLESIGATEVVALTQRRKW